MAESGIVEDSAETKSSVRLAMLIVSAGADFLAVTAFLATLIKRDPILIFSITISAAAIIGLAYKAKRSKYLMTRSGIATAFVVVTLSLVLAIIAWSLLANSSLTPVKIDIVDPKNNENVTLQHLVNGTVSNPKAAVYVIVHPLKVSEMWVQQLPIVDVVR